MSEISNRIADAIWTELERQQETERFGPCVGRKDDLIDGHVDMDKIAEAVVKELHLASTGHGHYAWGEGIGIGGFIPGHNNETLGQP